MKEKPGKPVKIAQFKAKLSEYLRQVRKGQELTIYDRDQPVAKVTAIEGAPKVLAVREPIVVYGSLARIPMPPPARLSVDAVDVLLEDRQAR
jgi:prevent-host-death family protein